MLSFILWPEVWLSLTLLAVLWFSLYRLGRQLTGVLLAPCLCEQALLQALVWSEQGYFLFAIWGILPLLGLHTFLSRANKREELRSALVVLQMVYATWLISLFCWLQISDTEGSYAVWMYLVWGFCLSVPLLHRHYRKVWEHTPHAARFMMLEGIFVSAIVGVFKLSEGVAMPHNWMFSSTLILLALWGVVVCCKAIALADWPLRVASMVAVTCVGILPYTSPMAGGVLVVSYIAIFVPLVIIKKGVFDQSNNTHRRTTELELGFSRMLLGLRDIAWYTLIPVYQLMLVRLPALVMGALCLLSRLVYRGDAQRTVAFVLLLALGLIVVMVEHP